MRITLLAWCLESWEYSQFSPFKHEPWTKNLQSILENDKKIESLMFLQSSSIKAIKMKESIFIQDKTLKQVRFTCRTSRDCAREKRDSDKREESKRKGRSFFLYILGGIFQTIFLRFLRIERDSSPSTTSPLSIFAFFFFFTKLSSLFFN